MPFVLIPVVGGRINHLILHHNGTSGTALTIDCPTKDFLNEVYGMFWTMDGAEIYNHDEGAGKQFHDGLHADMAAAMNTDLAGTLTNYHQHWVSTSHKSSLLLLGHAMAVLKPFKTKNWINGQAMLQAVGAVYNT